MYIRINPVMKSLLLAAFEYVFNDSLLDQEKVFPELLKQEQLNLLDAAQFSVIYNNEPFVFPTEEQINASAHKMWALVVGQTRELKEIHGCSPFGKRKVLRILRRMQFLDYTEVNNEHGY